MHMCTHHKPRSIFASTVSWTDLSLASSPLQQLRRDAVTMALHHKLSAQQHLSIASHMLCVRRSKGAAKHCSSNWLTQLDA
jgi:hypothetical protein